MEFFWFTCNFDFQYKPKATVMFQTLELPFVGVMNIMKIKNI